LFWRSNAENKEAAIKPLTNAVLIEYLQVKMESVLDIYFD
jgi:hypothetical protein